MPVEKKSDSKKHDRQILIGQKFSPNKSSVVYLKTTPPRSGLTWKPTGRIFTQVLQRLLNPFVHMDYLMETSYPRLLYISVTRTCKNGESNTSMLEDLTLLARNPVKEILPKLNLPDHRYKRRCCSLIPAELVSLPHAHIQD
ncbi:hypothetical protein Tco_0454150 [Tanacetum coccineum]